MLQLSASEFGKERLFKDCISLLSDVCNYVRESDKRIRHLEAMQDVCDKKAVKLRQLCPVLVLATEMIRMLLLEACMAL